MSSQFVSEICIVSSGILTDTPAMTALKNLAATQSALDTTRSQISSGLEVATASDNAAHRSISATLKSDTGALSAVSDMLKFGSSVVSTAMAAATSGRGSRPASRPCSFALQFPAGAQHPGAVDRRQEQPAHPQTRPGPRAAQC